MAVCSNCKKELAEGTLFCDACGAAVAPEAAPVYAEAAPAAPAEPAKNEKLKKLLTLGGIAAAAIVVIVLLVALFSGGKGDPFVLYAKSGGGVYYSDFSKEEPLKISKEGFGGYAYISKDGNKLFYLDKMDDDGDYTLYLRNPNKPKKDPVKLDSGVSGFAVNEKATKVLYEKDDTMYVHNLKEKTKIASNVGSVRFTEDLKKAVYTVNKDDQTDLYVWNGKKAEKLASDIGYLAEATKDCSVVYCVEEGVLYKYAGKKDKEKVQSDVTWTWMTETDDLYYTAGDEESSTLYFYNGKKTKELAKADSFGFDYEYSDDALLVMKRDGEDFTTCVLKNGTYSELAHGDEATDFRMNEKGDAVYYMDDVSEEDGVGTVYKAAVKKTVGKPEAYAKDVYSYSLRGEMVITKKDYKDGKYTLYVDNKEVEQDVGGIEDYDKETKTLLYMVDVNDKGEGTLMAYKGKKATKIADDVYEAQIVDKNQYVYIAEMEEDGGTLYSFKNGKAKEIDKKVTGLMDVYRLGVDE